MNNDLIGILKDGEIAVIPTDTIYGIVGSALNPQTVEKIYNLRKRAKDKPMIILIASLEDLQTFDIKLNDFQRNFLQKNWPNLLSVVLPISGDKYRYLHRGKYSLAFRMPKDENLLQILKRTGPLVAPSANLEGEKPSEDIDQAKKYFGNKIAFYLDAGTIHSTPSTLIEFNKGHINILRQGDLKI